MIEEILRSLFLEATQISYADLEREFLVLVKKEGKLESKMSLSSTMNV